MESNTPGSVCPTTSHLDDRVVVVTGAGSGFGRLVSTMSAARGARVVVADIDGAAARETAESISASGGVAVASEVDVTDLEAMHALATTAAEHFGGIDVMVNNAGTMPLAFTADHRQASTAWDRCIDVNLKGVLHGIIAVYEQMITRGRGHIVNIGSIYGNAGTPGSGVYSATKAAVVVLSDAVRREAQGKIKVTVVRPTGVIATGLASTVVNPAAAAGAVGTDFERFMDAAIATVGGTLDGPMADVDSPEFWAIGPETIASEVLHVIDQPWGVTISDVSIRATGEMFTI